VVEDIPVGVGAETDLLELVRTLRTGGGPPHPSDGRQHHPDQDGDDGEDDEQLHQAEAAPCTTGEAHDGTSGSTRASLATGLAVPGEDPDQVGNASTASRITVSTAEAEVKDQVAGYGYNPFLRQTRPSPRPFLPGRADTLAKMNL